MLKLTGFRVACLITLLTIGFYYFGGERHIFLQSLELKALDLRFKLRGPRPANDNIVIVAIDDYSLSKMGRWPWPRSYHAELLDILSRAGAKTIGFDLIFTAPEESPEIDKLRIIRQYYNSMSISEETEDGRQLKKALDEALKLSEHDRILGESLARNKNVVIALAFQNVSNTSGSRPEDDRQKATEVGGGSPSPPEDLPSPTLPAETVNPDDLPPLELLDDSGGSTPPPVDDLAELGNNDLPPLELLAGDNSDLPPLGLLEADGGGELPPLDLLDAEGGDELAPWGSLDDDSGGLDPADEGFLVPRQIKAAGIAAHGNGDRKPPSFLPEAAGLLQPLPEMYENAWSLGHVNAFTDIDGTIRRATLLIKYKGTIYPSLSLKLLESFGGLTASNFEYVAGEGCRFADSLLPVDEQGRMLINYYGPAVSYAYYPYADVIDGKTPASAFKDKIVLVGAAATGLGDVWTTPFSPSMPGVEKYAHIMGSILDKEFLYKKGSYLYIDMLLMLIFGILTGLILQKASPRKGVLLGLGMLLLFLGGNHLVFVKFGVWLNIVYPVLNQVMVSTAVLSFMFFTVHKDKAFLKKAFTQYLSPELVGQISGSLEDLKLGGQKKELTVLFSDIRSFTSFSEKLAPEDLVHLLNIYLSAMTKVVFEYKGVVDKFIGDAIMVIFGAPLDLDNHAEMACRTAINMKRELDRLNPELEAQGFAKIDIGIGINTGEMVVGNMGSENKFDYTVIGDNVNLSSRLEGLSKFYGVTIVISETTAARLQGFAMRRIDKVIVKGRSTPLDIYELLGLAGEYTRMAASNEKFDMAMELYYHREWKAALPIFEGLHRDRQIAASGAERSRRKSKLYAIYAERCRYFLQEPPPANWAGVFEHTSK